MSLWDAVSTMGLWILSLAAVPLLATIALGFGLVAVLGTFGIDWVQMEMFNWQVPTLWSIPAALVISVVSGAFSLGGAVMLRSYLRWMRSGFGAEA
jgi:hypothetical protein